MAHAQEDFTQAVNAAPIKDPWIPLVGNVSALPLNRANQVREDLQSQLRSRVRWTESIQAMVASGVNTFIEFGNGAVLSGLLKRIDRKTNRFSLGTPADFDKLLQELIS
jgi:[acyl-carrier-protein] S-malonyltransferase